MSLLSKTRILCVDDDEVVQHNIQALLGAAVHVHSALDGASGLAMVRKLPLDWILVDYQLPDMDGPEFIEKARLLRSKAGVILLSGLDVGQIGWEKLRGLGVRACFRKPLNPDMFVSLISENTAGEIQSSLNA